MGAHNSIDIELWPVHERMGSLMLSLGLLLLTCCALYFEPSTLGRLICVVIAYYAAEATLEDMRDFIDALQQKLLQKNSPIR